jgi:hypothetical protein
MWGILDLLACFAPLSSALSTQPRLFWADFSGQSLVPGWMLAARTSGHEQMQMQM